MRKETITQNIEDLIKISGSYSASHKELVQILHSAEITTDSVINK